MGNIHFEKRLNDIIEKLLSEVEPQHYLNELISLGYKKNFNEIIRLIEGECHDLFRQMNQFLLLNPGTKTTDLPFEREKMIIRRDLIKLLKERLNVSDELEVIPLLKKGLTEAERNYIKDQVKEINVFLSENETPTEERIEYLKGLVRGSVSYNEDSPYRRYYIKSIEKDIKILTKFKSNKASNTRKKEDNESIDQVKIGYKAIAIAARCMGIGIANSNKIQVLEMFENHELKSSDTLYNNRINDNKSLVELKINRSANTKHLTSLHQAQSLISNVKDPILKEKGEKVINQTLSAFNTKYKAKYHL